MSAISANLASPPDNFSTTLSSGISTSDLTIPLNSVTGLPTEGVGVLYRKETNGDVTVGSVEIIHWTGVAGSSLTLTNAADRGLTGSDAGAQAYIAGSYFEVWVTSYYYESLRDGIAAISFDMGALTAAATSKATPVDADSIPLSDSAASNALKKLTWANLKATLLSTFKATGAEVTTGTDDTKFATAKALGDAGVNTRLKSKIITATRDLAGVSGDVAYTGVGFVPTAVICLSNVDNTGVSATHSIGVSDSAIAENAIEIADGISIIKRAAIASFAPSIGNSQTAVMKTYDADGFTLTWTKTGAPTGTGQLVFLCFR